MDQRGCRSASSSRFRAARRPSGHFAGAGVSMGPPSNLPSFDALAAAISGGALTRKEGEGLDAFLGRVEQRGVNVQASARQFIDVPTSTPRRLHHLLVQLFRDESVVRIVTTNFDRHFTRALHRQVHRCRYLHGTCASSRPRMERPNLSSWSSRTTTLEACADRQRLRSWLPGRRMGDEIAHGDVS